MTPAAFRVSAALQIERYMKALKFFAPLVFLSSASIAQDHEAVAREWTRKLELSDKTLNLTYQSLMTSLEPTEQEALRNGQRKWIEFRDAECKYPRGWRSMYNCLIVRTDERTLQLKNWHEVN
jgi:uncharacterized protein YecT (DUF1311 family)